MILNFSVLALLMAMTMIITMSIKIAMTLAMAMGRSNIHCNCIVTRGGVYDEILPEPEGNPEGGGRDRASQYFLVLASRGLCHGSFKSLLVNTRCLEGNIATVIFQYSIVR